MRGEASDEIVGGFLNEARMRRNEKMLVVGEILLLLLAIGVGTAGGRRGRDADGAENCEQREDLAPADNEACDPENEGTGFRSDEGDATGEGLPRQELVAAVASAGGEVDGNRNQKMREKCKDVNSFDEVDGVLLLIEMFGGGRRRRRRRCMRLMMKFVLDLLVVIIRSGGSGDISGKEKERFPNFSED